VTPGFGYDRSGANRADPDGDDGVIHGNPIAIVILSLDDEARTLRCLESVFALDYEPIEVVLVDNGSKDATLETVARRYPATHRLRSATNLGVAGGRNRGVRFVLENFPGAHVLFLDNDAWIEPDALAAMVSVLEQRPTTGLVAPKIYRPGPGRRIAGFGGHHINWYTGSIRTVGSGCVDHGQFDGRNPITCNGAAFLVRREVLHRIGGFDDAFNPYGWEDLDFSLRAVRAGHRIALAPSARVYHEGGREGRGFAVPRYERSKMRGYFRLIRRHTTWAQWICFVAVFPVRAVAMSLRELLGGRGSIPWARLRGALGGLFGASQRAGSRRDEFHAAGDRAGDWIVRSD